MGHTLVRLIMALLLVLGRAAEAKEPDAVLLNRAGSDVVTASYDNIYLYLAGVSKAVRPLEAFNIHFDESSYNPTLVHFASFIRTKPKRELLETPVLIMMPGDSVWVTANLEQNRYELTGRHQAELDFCKKLWQNELGLAGLHFEMSVPATKVPIEQFLAKWNQLRLEGEVTLRELRQTPGIRPPVAAALARELRLRVFSILTLYGSYQRLKEPLRVLPKVYTDSVAGQARILKELQNLPVSSSQGMIGALNDYVSYKCVAQGHYLTPNQRYALAKEEFSGFRRAWSCYAVLAYQRANYKDITRLLRDYQTWVQPYGEFVRVLKGEPTVPLRSYKGTVAADMLTSPDKQNYSLADVLDAYKGQVVYIDLWASWCAPCLEEIPASARLSSRYQSRGLVVLYLSIDRDPEKWRQALKKLPKGARHRFVFLDPDKAAFLKELEVSSVPRYMLIDRDGIVRNPDALRPSDPQLRQVLEKMLVL